MANDRPRKPTFLSVVRAALRSQVLRKQLEALDPEEGWNEKDALCALLLALRDHCEEARCAVRYALFKASVEKMSVETLQERYKASQKALAKVHRLLVQASR